MSKHYESGTYKAEGQPDIIIGRGNILLDGRAGLWVLWRFEHSSESIESPIWDFDTMVEQDGYKKHEEKTDVGDG